MPSRAPLTLFHALDRATAVVCSGAAWLSIPIMLALALQWPLRDGLGRYSREANDLGQCLFALYVAVGVTAASRAGAHLAAHSPAHSAAHSSGGSSANHNTWRRRAMMLFGVAPWCAWVLWQGAALTLRSLLSLEHFPDTFNHGYFVIKLAMWLLALLLLVNTLMDGATSQPEATRTP